jgi:hypothetical protein
VAGVPQPAIITPQEWLAAAPRHRPELAGPPVRGLLHGTAGHHAEIENPRNESRGEFLRYCRAMQDFHMAALPRGRGWADAGQNFTIGRNGLIAVGRRYSLAAAKVGLTVVAAHCLGQNDQYGVELEHAGNEPPTPAQLDAYVKLMAWLFSRCGARPTELHGHRDYYATACPTPSLYDRLPRLRGAVAHELNRHGRDPASRLERARFRARYRAGLA